MNSITLTARRALAITIAATVAGSGQALAQTTPSCVAAQVIPLTTPEPPATIVVGTPLPEPLATRGVVVIPYCANHMRIVPVFGPGAASASPRVGHVHVAVDGATWVWADASGTPVILAGLAPGPHTVRIELVDANHRVVDSGATAFEVPGKPSAPRQR